MNKCDCGSRNQAKAWCYVHGYLNKSEKPSPSPIKKPAPKVKK